MPYPASPGKNPESAKVIEKVVQLALDNPMPSDLRTQIEDWIEPETLNCELKHRDVMTCIGIAFPLIRAYLAEHPDAALA